MRGTPKYLGHLYNLQVLILNSGAHEYLPTSITMLVNLRYLIFMTEQSLSPYLRISHPKCFKIKGIGRLHLLRSSISFDIRDEDGFHIGELKNMNSLQELLEIRYLDRVKSMKEALEDNIEKKENLKCLTLMWNSMTSHDNKMHENVLEALKPCKGLLELSILGYGGVKLSSWINNVCLSSLEVDKLPPSEAWLSSLRVLRLENCSNVEVLPPSLGKMPVLAILDVRKMHSLKEIIWEMAYSPTGECFLFKALEKLSFDDLPMWEELRVVGEEEKKEIKMIFPRINTIVIRKCPKVECLIIPSPILIDRFVDKCTIHSSKCHSSHGCEFSYTTTSLTSLSIENCENLTCLHLPTSKTALTVLGIEECPKLSWCQMQLPPIANIAYLFLTIEHGTISMSIDGGRKVWNFDFPLTTLETSSPLSNSWTPFNIFPNSIEFAGIHLENFNKDQVKKMLLNLCNIARVKSFTFSNCPYLVDLDDALHNSLEQIRLEYCPLLLSALDLRAITSLKDLSFFSCGSVVSLLLPASISLDCLHIEHCRDLIHLLSSDTHMSPLSSSQSPLAVHGSSLQVTSLSLVGCSQEQLVKVLQQIEPTRLKELDIRDCSDLEHFHAYEDRGVQMGPTILQFTSLTVLKIDGWEPFGRSI